MSSTVPITEKGARYLGQLDQALCNGDWPSIAELARKLEKHAPQRKGFALTARSQAQIGGSSNAPSSTSPSNTSSLTELVPKLREAISAGESFPEDAYAAKVCLAEVHWLQENLEAALDALQQDGSLSKTAGTRGVALGWLEVCAVKAEFIRIAALEAAGREDEAWQVGLGIASRTPGSRTPELRRWTERLLARICMLSTRRIIPTCLSSLSESLQCFTAWSDFWQRTSSTRTTGNSTGVTRTDISRRRIWKAYYDLVSDILQRGLMYNPSPSSASDLLIERSLDMSLDDYTASKIRQRTAIKKVEMTYESLLLHETQFPKASQTNVEVEEWVQQVVTNWKIFNGPEWNDAEFGQGGKETLSRGVLDVLYRAATKTFHSTAILRHLFTIHAAIEEFQLAIYALDSYIEIISKGKARAVKTGGQETGFDTDDSAIVTVAEGVRVLCRYGDREQAEKAMEVKKTIERWLAQSRPTSNEDAKTNSDDNRTKEASAPGQSTESLLRPQTLALAYRAIGTAQAHWARLTYEAESRTKLQADALGNLRLAQKYGEASVETGYALALVLAESRDLASATKVIKHVIASAESANDSDDEEEEIEDNTRKRLLIPVWHLLALCLTAKDDYGQGLKMCEAAFEQFGDDSVLFGEESMRVNSSDGEKQPSLRPRRGLVDLMEGFEKETILQIRMTQLTFVELMEGPEPAVDMSHELLGLYARLFGNPEPYRTTLSKPPPTAASAAPSRLGGTLRSIAGSIRPKSARASVERDPRVTSSVSLPARGKQETDGVPNGDGPGIPISITVTNEDGVRTEKSHHHKHLSFMRRGIHSDSRPSLRERRSFRKDERPLTPVQKSQIPEHAAVLNGGNLSSAAVDASVSSDSPKSPEQPLKEMAHNAPHDGWPPPSGHEQQPPRQDVRLPAPDPASSLVPDPRPRSAKDRQQQISLLLKIWLFIGGLYLRSELLDDAASATNEASRLVESFETEVASEHSSARRFYERGWGGGKSVDALWADVESAKGYLALARERPFEAISHFEQALAHFPDHTEATIGISNLLMDIYEEKIPPEEPQPLLSSQPSPSSSAVSAGIPPPPQLPVNGNTNDSGMKDAKPPIPPNKKSSSRNLTPAELNRLAARDRAYMLLSSLTRLGTGWDNSQAWFTLARAHELSKQVSKAKQALWWVVELEENEPIRPWREVAAGGFTL